VTPAASTGGPQAAMVCFIAFYLACTAVTWWFYLRRSAEMPC
jgi:NNP family nitrate/nitrite transporter-like MFS transporter